MARRRVFDPCAGFPGTRRTAGGAMSTYLVIDQLMEASE